MNKAITKLKQQGPRVANLVDFLVTKGVDFKLKEDIKWMSLVGKINPDFTSYVTTTLGNTIYLPKDLAYKEIDTVKMLAHEYVHVLDNRKHTFYKLSYSFPQILSIFGFLGILGFWSPYYVLFSCFFGCLFRLPSPFRLHWELRGYTMTMAVERWVMGKVQEETKEDIIKALYSKNYWLVVSKTTLARLITAQLSKIEEGELMSDPAFHQVQMFLVENRYARHSLLDL